MHSRRLILALGLVASALTESCSTPDGDGTCLSTSSCSTFSVAGYCSGSSSNQCCIQQTCSTSAGSGICRSSSKPCSGTYYSGACPGDSSIQCCVSSSGGGGSSTAAIDISAGQSSSFWSCARQNNQKVVIRGYRQSCGSGGGVDTSLLGSYNAARNAGFTNIDIYFFPCTGTQPNGIACKSPSQQVSEMESYISNNGLSIGNIWLDIEPTSGTCNAWNLGSTANTNLARQYTSLARNSQYSWGIYANANQWSGMFGSTSVDVGSDLPLWAVQADGTSGVNAVTRFMGGWTSAYGKQYKIGESFSGRADTRELTEPDTTQCGAGVDLDSFLG